MLVEIQAAAIVGLAQVVTAASRRLRFFQLEAAILAGTRGADPQALRGDTVITVYGGQARAKTRFKALAQRDSRGMRSILCNLN